MNDKQQLHRTEELWEEDLLARYPEKGKSKRRLQKLPEP